MASTKKVADDHWIVSLAAESKSEVVVEIHMSRAKAEELIAEEWDRLYRLGSRGHTKEDVGDAVLSILSRGAT